MRMLLAVFVLTVQSGAMRHVLRIDPPCKEHDDGIFVEVPNNVAGWQTARIVSRDGVVTCSVTPGPEDRR
jgi:hypothetical protein